MTIALDEKDQRILAGRVAALDEVEGPRVGDFVRFADGVVRRVSYHWGDTVQTSDGGSYYLGNGWVSMSGSLYPGVPVGLLTLTDETRDGSVWFFHHDWAKAHNGVHASIPFRVFSCSLPCDRAEARHTSWPETVREREQQVRP